MMAADQVILHNSIVSFFLDVPSGAPIHQDLPPVVSLCSHRERRAKEVASDLAKSAVRICWISGPLGSGKSAFGKILLHQIAQSIGNCLSYYFEAKSFCTVKELVDDILKSWECQESIGTVEEQLHLEIKRRENVVFLFDNCDLFLQREGHKPFLKLIRKSLQRKSVISLITTCFECPYELEAHPVTVDMLQKDEAAEMLSSYHNQIHFDESNRENLLKVSALFCGMPFPLVALGRRKTTFQQKYYNKLSPQYKFLQNFHRVLPSAADELNHYFNERLQVLTDDSMLRVLCGLAVYPGRFSWKSGSEVVGQDKAANFKDCVGKLVKRNLLLQKADRYQIPELLRQYIRDFAEVDHSQAFERYSKTVMKSIKTIIDLYKIEPQKAVEQLYRTKERLTEFFFRATLGKAEVCQYAAYFAKCPPLRNYLPYSILRSFYEKAISVASVDKVWKAAFRLSLADIALEDVLYSPTQQTLKSTIKYFRGALFLEKDIHQHSPWLQKLYWKVKAVVELAAGGSSSEKAIVIFEHHMLKVKESISADEWNLLARAHCVAAANKPQSTKYEEHLDLAAAHYRAAVATAKEERNHKVRLPAEVRFGECCFRIEKYTVAKKKFVELLDSKELPSVKDYFTCRAALLYSKALAQIGENVSTKKESFWRYEELQSVSNILENALCTFETTSNEESDRGFHPLRPMITVAAGKVDFIRGLVAGLIQRKDAMTCFDQAMRSFSKVGQFEDGEVVNALKSEANTFLSIVRDINAASRNDAEFSQSPIALTGASFDKAVKLFLDSNFNVITDIDSLFTVNRLNSSESFDVLFRFSFLYSDAVEGRRKRELLECIDTDDDSDDGSSDSVSDSMSDSDDFRTGSVEVLTGETSFSEPRSAFGDRSPKFERKKSARVFYDSFETTPARKKKAFSYAVQETAGAETATSGLRATITLPQSHMTTDYNESLEEVEESTQSPPTLEQAKEGDSKN